MNEKMFLPIMIYCHSLLSNNASHLFHNAMILLPNGTLSSSIFIKILLKEFISFQISHYLILKEYFFQYFFQENELKRKKNK